MVINHNLMANNAIRSMNTNSTAASKSMAKLSSGLRINSASDDAAGLAISEKMRGQIRGLDQASSNAQDGISMVQTAEGALSETTSILQRMRELAVQSGTDTNTTDDRGAIQKEMNALTSEINRIGNTTEFNTQKLINGNKTGTAVDAKTTLTQVAGAVTGAAGVDTITVGSGGFTVSGVTIGTAGVAITATAAAAAITASTGLSTNYTATATSATTFTLTQKIPTAGNPAIVGMTAGTAGVNTVTMVGSGGFTVSGVTIGTTGTALTATAAAVLINADAGLGANYTATATSATTFTLTQITPSAAANPVTAGTGIITSDVATTAGGASVSIDTVTTTGVTAVKGTEILATSGIKGVDVITLTGASGDISVDGITVTGSFGAVNTATNLAASITGNATLNDKYTVSATDATHITLTQKTATTGDPTIVGTGIATDAVTTTGITAAVLKDGVGTLQIGANTSQQFTVDISDMRSKALKISGDGTSFASGAANELSDTSLSGTKEYALDVTSAPLATAAITTIDAAIKNVSSERAKLGAYSNRLEHTIANLGTTSENMTSAESRIRDVDMAKEMSTYSKNNILSQAAQAMLAQANQQPQQVLSLLR